MGKLPYIYGIGCALKSGVYAVVLLFAGVSVTGRKLPKRQSRMIPVVVHFIQGQYLHHCICLGVITCFSNNGGLMFKNVSWIHGVSGQGLDWLQDHDMMMWGIAAISVLCFIRSGPGLSGQLVYPLVVPAACACHL